MSTALASQLDAAARRVLDECEAPEIGVVLGSGLGSFATELSGATTLTYATIPHMPNARVAGHAGNLVVGRLGKARVACLQGRVHLYEGHAVERVVFGVRLLARIGCRTVLLTNAAGGIGASLAPGDLMLIVDHLNLTGHNPLVGPAEPSSTRFVDMGQAYDADLQQAAREAAAEVGIELREGVYAATLGPSYETPAEVRMLRGLGADAVGMSTALEVIALRQCQVRVGAVSCITNLATGLAQHSLDHEDVQRVAARARDRFCRLLTVWVRRARQGLEH